MSFNVKKSKIIIFSDKKFTHNYSIEGQTLAVVDHALYFGLTIQSNLKFDMHI